MAHTERTSRQEIEDAQPGRIAEALIDLDETHNRQEQPQPTPQHAAEPFGCCTRLASRDRRFIRSKEYSLIGICKPNLSPGLLGWRTTTRCFVCGSNPKASRLPRVTIA